MPQVATQAPANLMEMFGSGDPLMGDIAMGQVNQNRSINNLNSQQALQDMFIQQQKLPYELGRMSLENQGLEAQLPGHRADSSLREDKASISRNTLAKQQDQAIADIAAKISTDHLAEAENGVKQMLTSPDPRVRAMGNQLFTQLSSVKQKKMELDAEYARALAVAKEQSRGHLEVEQAGIAANKYGKAHMVSLQQKIQNEGDPVKRDALLRGAIASAQQEGDQQAEIYYTKLLQANIESYNNARAAQTAAAKGKLDIGEVAGMPGYVPPTATVPASAPTAAPAATQLSPDVIKGAFGAYEPNKYVYRVNPQTGKLQRKPL